MCRNSLYGGALAAFFIASLGVAGCTTNDSVSTSSDPYGLPYYDRFGYNQHGYHEPNYRGARCVRLSDSGTCAWWLTG